VDGRDQSVIAIDSLVSAMTPRQGIPWTMAVAEVAEVAVAAVVVIAAYWGWRQARAR
jgi:hypothetical protein